MKIKESYEHFISHIFWYRHEFYRWIGIVLNFVMPIILGKYAGEAYKSITTEPDIWSWDVWEPHWPVLGVVLLWFIGYIIKRYVNHISLKSEELYNSLKWFCEDLGTRSNLEKDIRCTIWIPIGRKSRTSPIRLMQVVHYYPKTSTLIDKISIRSNGIRYRTFKVSKRNKKSSIKPIGILGLTALQCVSGDEPTITRESFDSRINFEDHMVNNWNFSKFQAGHLTLDRKSYLCLPIVTKTKSELLGILYFDSRRTRTFDNNFVSRTEKYLPRFASIITNL